MSYFKPEDFDVLPEPFKLGSLIHPEQAARLANAKRDTEMERLRRALTQTEDKAWADKGYLNDEITRLRGALENCRHVTLNAKYGNNAEWVRINVDGIVTAALKGEE